MTCFILVTADVIGQADYAGDLVPALMQAHGDVEPMKPAVPVTRIFMGCVGLVRLVGEFTGVWGWDARLWWVEGQGLDPGVWRDEEQGRWDDGLDQGLDPGVRRDDGQERWDDDQGRWDDGLDQGLDPGVRRDDEQGRWDDGLGGGMAG